MSAALERQLKVICQLEEIAGALHQQLAGVLLPPVAAEETGACPEAAAASPLVYAISERTDRIQCVVRDMVEIKERLEV